MNQQQRPGEQPDGSTTTLAEWLAIAKDKVGDLIVTFLALFAALLMNSTIAPIVLPETAQRTKGVRERRLRRVH